MDDNIKLKIKNSHYHKYGGIAPEGFIMIPKETFEKLKDFDIWKEWKINPESLLNIAIEDSKKL